MLCLEAGGDPVKPSQLDSTPRTIKVELEIAQIVEGKQ
jgi:hypothetical protein